MEIEMQYPRRIAVVILICCAVIMVMLAREFGKMHIAEPIYPGEGVTEVRMLSDYLPQLKESAGDTEIYVLRGEREGASMLVLGGTHPREPAGMLSAVTLIENASAQQGILYIIPRVNKSAYTCTEPLEGTPSGFTINTPDGPRYFRNASRVSNPIDQWPDPDIYQHITGQQLTGKEVRNINRVYPGKADGELTEQIAAGIVAFINAEGIDVTIDLHEGPPEFLSVNAVIAHENAMDLTTQAVFNMSFDDVELDVQASPKELHGYSHRELGDYTETMAVLPETCNIEQGRLHGLKNDEMLLDAKSKYYVYAAGYGKFSIPYTDEGTPIDLRVARHIETVLQYAIAYNEMEYGKSMEFSMPAYSEIISNGLGAYLCPKESHEKECVTDGI